MPEREREKEVLEPRQNPTNTFGFFKCEESARFLRRDGAEQTSFVSFGRVYMLVVNVCNSTYVCVDT